MRFKFLSIILFLLFILLIIGQSSAAEFRVNNNNSTEDINAIINTMNVNDTLFFEDGVYQDKTILINKNNITLTANKDKVLFNGSGLSYNQTGFNITGLHVVIENINVSNYFDGIYSYGYNTINNCNLYDNENGMFILGNFNIISNILTHHNGNNGIVILGHNNTVSNCVIFNNRDGLWIMGDFNYVFNILTHDNRLGYETTYGIFIQGVDNHISNFTSYNNSFGIHLEGYNSSISNGNACSNSLGISIEGDYNNVSYCNGSDNNQDGIIIVGSYSNIINSMANNNYFGIFVLGRFTNIIGCIANYNGQYGIHTAGSHNNSTVTGNNNVSNSIAINNRFYGIFLEGGEDFIYNCTVEGGMFGIAMTRNNNNLYNSIVSNADYGIFFERGSNFNITGNVIHNNLYGFGFGGMGSLTNVNIDFNLIFNNTNNFYIDTRYSTNNLVANYNWWGGDSPINEFSGLVLIEYYIMGASLINSSHVCIGDEVTLNYEFIMNDTEKTVKLPDFVSYLINEDIIIKLNGDSKGYANIPINSIDNTIYLIFNGVELANLNYIASPSTGTLFTSDVTTFFGECANITGIFKDVNDNPLENKELTLFIFGSNYYATTDETGLAVFYNISSLIFRTSLFTIFYDGDDYICPPVNGNFLVNPIQSLLSLESMNNSYVNDNVLFKISLKDINDKPLKNVSLKLTIDGKEYIIKTDDKGIATFNQIFTKEGNFKIDISINQEEYVGENITKYVQVLKKASLIAVSDYNSVYNNIIILQGKLEHNKQMVKNQIIYFYVNNVFVGTGKTDDKGIARLSYKVNLTGKLTVKAVHQVNNEYLGDVKVSYLNVPKLSVVKLKNTKEIKTKQTKNNKNKGNTKKYLILRTEVYNWGPNKSSFEISYKIPKNLILKNIYSSNFTNKMSFNKKTQTITWKINNINSFNTNKIAIILYPKVNKKKEYSFKPKVQKVNTLQVSYNNKITLKI